MSTLLKPAEAARILDVSTQTLRNWSNTGRLRCSYTEGGNARYKLCDLKRASGAIGGRLDDDDPESTSYIYARVSSYKQKAYLQRQIDFLRSKFPNHQVITDIGSGVNFSRKGLVSLLDRCLAGHVNEVVVAHRDRLARIGFDLLEHIITRAGSILTVSEDPDCHGCFKELSDDLMAVVTHFAARHHGRRKYKSSQDSENQDPSDPGASDASP